MSPFSLTTGGPCHAVLHRVGRRTDAAESDPVTRSAAVVALVAWVPLLVFSALQGLALGDTKLPFFLNYPEHVRFLLAVPLLILAESFINGRLRLVVEHFRQSGLVRPEDLPKVEAALDRVRAGRDSVVCELVLLVLAYALSATAQIVTRGGVPRDWLYAPGSGGARLSLAGLWFFWFSLPLYQFLLYRWVWRHALWSSFLRRVSRLKLQLVATHPDHVGGLEVVGRAQAAFLAVAFPAACVVAATLYQRVTILRDVSPGSVVSVFVVLCLVLFLGPLMFFTPQLVRTRQQGLVSYGLFADAYVRAFDEKWIRRRETTREPSLGSADIQSLSDMGGSFRLVTEMRLVLIDKWVLLVFAVGTALPFAPLVLTQVPLSEVLKMVVGMVSGR